jgi:tRNA/rRNA methyltransferase
MNEPAALALAEPDFVLVRPQMGENVGAAARAMLNFGLSRMVLVAPRDGWPNDRAVATASGAARVLDNARLVASTVEAVGPATHVYATTARGRELVKPVMTPEAAMADARARIRAGERVAVLFGPERTGLETDDIVLANTLVTVPVNPGFASLNLAQCVLLTGYEWLRSGDAPLREIAWTDAPATAAERRHLLDRLEERLDRARFFWPEERRGSMIANLRTMFSRMALTATDIRTLHAVFRALADRHPARRDRDSQ